MTTAAHPEAISRTAEEAPAGVHRAAASDLIKTNRTIAARIPAKPKIRRIPNPGVPARGIPLPAVAKLRNRAVSKAQKATPPTQTRISSNPASSSRASSSNKAVAHREDRQAAAKAALPQKQTSRKPNRKLIMPNNPPRRISSSRASSSNKAVAHREDRLHKTKRARIKKKNNPKKKIRINHKNPASRKSSNSGNAHRLNPTKRNRPNENPKQRTNPKQPILRKSSKILRFGEFPAQCKLSRRKNSTAA